MSDEPEKIPSPEGEDKPQYASPVKRAWAWVGVVYAVGILLLFTWYMATAVFITGIGPLMLVPALAGLAATVILRYRAGEAKGGLPVCVLFTAVCLGLMVLNLIAGIPALMANFGG